MASEWSNCARADNIRWHLLFPHKEADSIDSISIQMTRITTVTSLSDRDTETEKRDGEREKKMLLKRMLEERKER